MEGYDQITEGAAKLIVPKAAKLTKRTAEMPVFYNPVMKFNRDISVILLNSLGKKDMQIADPLAGTGIRGIRFLLELKKGVMRSIYFNDYSRDALKITQKCLEINGINWDPAKIIIENDDANDFMLKSKGFDYIDIDPFGSPNPFLDSAMKRISREGILAVTATDTAALCGSSPKAGLRKYYAKPLRNGIMHETGLRILIRKVQLIGAQYDKALIPIFSYSKDHYMRAFFRVDKSKETVDDVMKQHKYILFCDKCLSLEVSDENCGRCSCGGRYDYAGPLFAGELSEAKLVEKMIAEAKSSEVAKYLEKMLKELKYKTVGFHDIPKLCKKNSIRQMPKKEVLLTKLKGAETIFNENGIKSKMKVQDVVKVLKE